MTPNDQCICYQINARNCPVHQDNRGSASNSSSLDPITQPFSYLQAEIEKLQAENRKLREAYGVVRAAMNDILIEVGTSTLTNKIATRALAKAEEGLK